MNGDGGPIAKGLLDPDVLGPRREKVFERNERVQTFPVLAAAGNPAFQILPSLNLTDHGLANPIPCFAGCLVVNGPPVTAVSLANVSA